MWFNESLKKLLAGSDDWNSWRTQHPDQWVTVSHRKLAGVMLRKYDLSFTSFEDCDLTGATFDGCKLNRVSFERAELSRSLFHNCRAFRGWFHQTTAVESMIVDCRWDNTHFDGIKLLASRVDTSIFANCSFEQADLRLVRVSDTILDQCYLGGANMDRAILSRASFVSTSLANVTGLSTVGRLMPFTLSLDTLAVSGSLPTEFLDRMAGSELLAPARDDGPAEDDNVPPEYHSCFISYSSRDVEFASRLYSELRREGIQAWYAPEDLHIGQPLRTTIDGSIRQHDKLLLILSHGSLGSPWVEQEVESAMQREKESNAIVLFPIMLDDAVLKSTAGWAALIRNTRHIGDFRAWRNTGEYVTAFARLKRDLRRKL
jgi:hypothetical protein